MTTSIKTFGRLTLLFLLTMAVLAITATIEISVDALTAQTRGLQHHFKHSLGNIGSLMVALSLGGYAIKKRYKNFPGMLKDWLELHQWFAAIGVAIVGIHSGVHFSAVVPVITLLLMLVCFVSGFIGRHIYVKAKSELATRKTELLKSGMTTAAVEETLAVDIVMANYLAKWRVVHKPFAILLAVFLMFHIVSALYFGG